MWIDELRFENELGLENEIVVFSCIDTLECNNGLRFHGS